MKNRSKRVWKSQSKGFLHWIYLIVMLKSKNFRKGQNNRVTQKCNSDCVPKLFRKIFDFDKVIFFSILIFIKFINFLYTLTLIGIGASIPLGISPTFIIISALGQKLQNKIIPINTSSSPGIGKPRSLSLNWNFEI